MKHFERLNLGLYTAEDPASIPEGALQRATNCRYRSGSSSLWQAEGRKLIGGGGHADVPIRYLASIEWDKPLDIGEQLEQLIYVKENRGNFELRVLPLTEDGSGMTPADSVLYNVDWNVPGGAINPVAFAGEFFFPSLGVWMRRKNGIQETYLTHLPSISSGLQCVKINAGDIYHYALGGTYVYWVTIYDATTDREGPAFFDALVNNQVVKAAADWEGSAFMVQLNLDVLQGLFATRVAANVNSRWYFRVYRTIVAESTQSGTTTTNLTTDDPLGTTGTPHRLIRHNDVKGRTFGWPDARMLTEVQVKGLSTVWHYHEQPGQEWLEVCRDYPAYNGDSTKHPAPQPLSGPVFPSTVVQLGKRSVAVSTNEEAPAYTTLTAHAESLVGNDPNDPGIVRYTPPGLPHYWPSVFYIRFDSEFADRVIRVFSAGRAIGVFMRSQLWRVNYLPTDADPNFESGRVADVVIPDHGIYYSTCVTTLHWPGLGPAFVFANRRGLYITDLFDVVELSTNVQWQNVVADPIFVINDPLEQRLLVIYNTREGTQEMFSVHYDQTHMVNGKPAFTGPIQRPGGIAAMLLGYLSESTPQLISTDNHGNLFYESIGFVDESTGAPLGFDVETRELYLAGMGREFHTNHVYAHVSPSDWGGGPFSSVLEMGPLNSFRFDNVLLTGRMLLDHPAEDVGQFAKLRMIGTAQGAGMAINTLGLEYMPLEGGPE